MFFHSQALLLAAYDITSVANKPIKITEHDNDLLRSGTNLEMTSCLMLSPNQIKAPKS